MRWVKLTFLILLSYTQSVMINLSIRLTCDALAVLCERRLGDTVWRGDSQMCTMSTRKPVVAQQPGESSPVPADN